MRHHVQLENGTCFNIKSQGIDDAVNKVNQHLAYLEESDFTVIHNAIAPSLETMTWDKKSFSFVGGTRALKPVSWHYIT